jgi:hypothetical protein
MPMSSGMEMTPAAFVFTLLAATGSVLTLYIMRRRVRLGRRVPKF